MRNDAATHGVKRAGKKIPRPVLAGMLYFASVFAVAFVLGVIRTLLLEPRIGHLTAVLVETPIMLVVSFDAAMRVVDVLSVPRAVAPRIFMGAVAFALLMLAEFTLAYGLQRTSPPALLQSFFTPAGAVTLAVFFLFAAMPVIIALAAPRKRDSKRAHH